MWPSDWQDHLQMSTPLDPWSYTIVQREDRDTIDEAADPRRYDGGSIVWLQNVPEKAEEATIRAWLLGGLEAALPHIVRARNAVAHAVEDQAQAAFRLRRLVNMPAETEEDEQRKAVMVAAKERVLQKCVDLKELAEHQLEKKINSLRSERVGLVPLNRVPSKTTALWKVEFARADRAEFALRDIAPRQWDCVRVVQPRRGVLQEEPYVLLPDKAWNPSDRPPHRDEVGVLTSCVCCRIWRRSALVAMLRLERPSVAQRFCPMTVRTIEFGVLFICRLAGLQLSFRGVTLRRMRHGLGRERWLDRLGDVVEDDLFEDGKRRQARLEAERRGEEVEKEEEVKTDT